MWPTIPLVVSQATVGTAMGLTTSLQMIGIGICNLIVGQILGKEPETDRYLCQMLIRFSKAENAFHAGLISPINMKNTHY